MLAFSPTFWSQATRAEVYALNSLLVAGLILLALAAGRRARRLEGGAAHAWRLLVGAAPVFGLGACPPPHHHPAGAGAGRPTFG